MDSEHSVSWVRTGTTFVFAVHDTGISNDRTSASPVHVRGAYLAILSFNPLSRNAAADAAKLLFDVFARRVYERNKKPNGGCPPRSPAFS